MDIISSELSDTTLEFISPKGKIYTEDEIKKNNFFEYRPGKTYKVIKVIYPVPGKWQIRIFSKENTDYIISVMDSRRVYILKYEQ